MSKFLVFQIWANFALNQICALAAIAFENIFDNIANLYIVIAKFKSVSRIQNLLKFNITHKFALICLNLLPRLQQIGLFALAGAADI